MPKKTLTAAFVDAVKVNNRTEYFDENTSGLGLRVSPNGNKSFFYRYRHNGRNRRYTIGRYSKAMSLKDAREKADELRLEVKRGGDPQGEEQSIKSRSPLTFGEIVNQYK
ncbi:MAG: Arm DNA-binding domain-containing protein, partial [Bacteroidota bacterium]